MAATFSVSSACECQAVLGAHLDEKQQVVAAWAATASARDDAPAHSIGAPAERFDIGWHCPFCGRNTMRTFYAGALRRVRAPAA